VRSEQVETERDWKLTFEGDYDIGKALRLEEDL
jgi:hypothetical protein